MSLEKLMEQVAWESSKAFKRFVKSLSSATFTTDKTLHTIVSKRWFPKLGFFWTKSEDMDNEQSNVRSNKANMLTYIGSWIATLESWSELSELISRSLSPEYSLFFRRYLHSSFQPPRGFHLSNVHLCFPVQTFDLR